MIGENDIAPGFSLQRDGGDTVSMEDFQGKYVVLYFYPKDNTPGCTVEAIEFSQHLKDFADLDCVVLGVSPDTVRKHDNFVKKQGLRVILLADTEKELVGAYGLWVEKKMYGRTYMGVERSTFLIGPDKKVLRAWNRVKVKGHVAEVLATLREIA